MMRLFILFCFFAMIISTSFGRDAEACVVFCVIDDQGVPVHNAKVNVYFDMQNRADGRRIIGNTDSNGICRLQGRTSHTLEIKVEKNGYYRYASNMNLNTQSENYEIVLGKWRPWGGQKVDCIAKNQKSYGGQTGKQRLEVC